MLRVMTRAHGNCRGSDMCWRDHAIHRVVSGDAASASSAL